MGKFIHLGDLHLGIKFHKRDLLADQTYVLDQVLKLVESEDADVIVAGDVYDTVNPPIAAQKLWFHFLRCVQEFGHRTYVISGNHDSIDRLTLGDAFLYDCKVVLVPPELPFYFEDMDDWVLVLLPFLNPSIASSKYKGAFRDYTSAFERAISQIDNLLKSDKPKVLVAHQSFEGAVHSESEFKPFMPDSVDIRTVQGFEEVWAGHLHAHQKLGNVTYSGSLLPYAFGDDYNQGVSVWERTDSGWKHNRVPISILHPLKEVSGDLEHCLSIPDDGSYVKVKLVDEDDLDNAICALDEHFERLCCVVRPDAKKWEAELNKPIGNFGSFEEAVNAFCEHLEIPQLDSEQEKLMEDAINAYKKAEA